MPNLAMQDVFVHISRIPSNSDTTGKIISEAWLVDGFKEDKATPYFSHPEEATRTFMQYAASGFFHNQTYFTRYLHVGIFPGESPDIYRVEGSWLDTVHEIFFNLEVENDSTILAAKASVFHRPDPMCSPSGRAIENLIGHRLKEIDYRTAQALVCGPMGCLHLADITLRAAQFYKQACL